MANDNANALQPPRSRNVRPCWAWGIVMAALGGAGLLAAFHFLGPAHSQSSMGGGPCTASIARWQNDADAAISFTFDDGSQGHRDKVMPLLDAFGFKATFYVIAGKMREHRGDPAIPEPRFAYGEAALSWDEVKELHADGQEIGNHSLAHTFLDRITDQAELEREINGAADIIAAHIGERPVTFAYPYNQISPLCREVALQRHIAAREQWTDYGGANFTTDMANGLVLRAIRDKAWLVPMIHGIDTGFMPLSSQVLHDHLAFIQRHSRQLWVDTYADVVRYQQERQAITLSVLDSHSNMLEFILTSPGSARYDVPLTVIVSIPADAAHEDVQARSGNQVLACVYEPGRILVHVPPEAGKVSVTWK